MKEYSQITSQERYIFSHLRKQGCSQAEIARQTGRHRSTIGREFCRNSSRLGHYRPFKAQEKSNGRRSRSRRNEQFGDRDYLKVHFFLRRQWSPEQIAGRLKRNKLLNISHETIYRHIWADKAAGGVLYTHLRGASKQRRKRYKSYDSRGRLAGKRHISERPASIEKRERIGHWEVDTVVGSGDQHSILTLVERKTGYVLIGKLPNRSKLETKKRAIKLIEQDQKRFKTITADNGTEFHSYLDIEERLGVRFYFATPYHSWQRGSNENTNGLIRQYLPKRKSMSHINQHHCNAIAEKLNTRPRKRLGYKTPEECYERRF